MIQIFHKQEQGKFPVMSKIQINNFLYVHGNF